MPPRFNAFVPLVPKNRERPRVKARRENDAGTTEATTAPAPGPIFEGHSQARRPFVAPGRKRASVSARATSKVPQVLSVQEAAPTLRRAVTPVGEATVV
eukprot:CAMPEP_0197392574 /NCGR_PEP_ID=MMETSP1165-20131217/3803_1 /TAXON_ID=284809 /ORGANISM="Chrysocystis fragilis, Strain CCMP3189" /LENGTH=98 /DNA_ID=CAMNT_0042918203 /DNA_START=45 /DNA_END=338 /DNA_ORIENTATION=-